MIFYQVFLKRDPLIIEAKDVEDFKEKLSKISVADVIYEPEVMNKTDVKEELKKRGFFLISP